MIDQTEVEGLKDDLDRLRRNIDRAVVGNSTINVNAGGVGVWLATTCCIVSVVACGFLALTVFDQNRKIDDLEHYLNAIYMMAPQLKPEEPE